MKTLMTLALGLMLLAVAPATAHSGAAVYGQCYQADGSGGYTALHTDDPTSFDAQQAVAAAGAVAAGAPTYLTGDSEDLCTGEPEPGHHDTDGAGVEANTVAKTQVCYDGQLRYDEATGNGMCRDPRHEGHH